MYCNKCVLCTAVNVKNPLQDHKCCVPLLNIKFICLSMICNQMFHFVLFPRRQLPKFLEWVVWARQTASLPESGTPPSAASLPWSKGGSRLRSVWLHNRKRLLDFILGYAFCPCQTFIFWYHLGFPDCTVAVHPPSCKWYKYGCSQVYVHPFECVSVVGSSTNTCATSWCSMWWAADEIVVNTLCGVGKVQLFYSWPVMLPWILLTSAWTSSIHVLGPSVNHGGKEINGNGRLSTSQYNFWFISRVGNTCLWKSTYQIHVARNPLVLWISGVAL